MGHHDKIDRRPKEEDKSPLPAAPVPEAATGVTLPSDLKEEMEGRLHHNFGKVRVHADDHAAASAESVGAKAFARNGHLFFGRDRYQPSSPIGRQLIAHELTHVVQASRGPVPDREVSSVDDASEREAAAVAAGSGPAVITAGPSARIHRDPTATPPPAGPPPAPPPGGPPPGAPPDADAAKALEEQENAAFEVAKGKVGQPAAKAWYSNPKSTSRSVETESFTIEEFVHPPGTTPARKGFDNKGTATTFAVFNSADRGAVVMQQDKFFFVAKLKKGDHKLSTVKPTFLKENITLTGFLVGGPVGGLVNPNWLRTTSDIVYRVEPSTGVVAVASNDGKYFPLNEDLSPEADRQELMNAPVAGKVPEAGDLRAYAGIAGDPDKPGEQPKQTAGVPIPEADQKKFIDSYFRSRAKESLDQNESMATKLAESFKPTEPGPKPKGVSDSAMKLIDSARVLGVYYKQALDTEAQLAAEHEYLREYLMWWKQDKTYDPIPKVTFKGTTKQLDEWISAAAKDLETAGQKKMQWLSLSPLLATMASHQLEPLKRSTTVHQPTPHIASQWAVTTPNPYDASLLAKNKTPEADEAVRADFEKKLDAIRQAIRQARGKANAGDLDYLLGLDGLRSRVTHDFETLKAPNDVLKGKLKEMLAAKKTKDDVVMFGAMAIDLALAFVPGGQLISACMGVVMHAAQQGDAAEKMVAATATSLDPAKALADQQAMAAQMMTADLVFIGMFLLQAKSIASELKAMGGAPKAGPPPAIQPPEGGGTAGGAGGGKTNTNWPPPHDPNAPPGTNKNWPPGTDPHGPTQLDPHGKPVDPQSKTGVDPHGKTDPDPNKTPQGGQPEADPAGSKTPNANAPAAVATAPPAKAIVPEEVLDATAYREVPFSDFIGGNDPGKNPGKTALVGPGEKKYLFKDEAFEMPIVTAEPMGIKAGDRARRAPAAAAVAEKLGLTTPKAKYVMWNGRIGSLQEWMEGTTPLAQLYDTDRKLYQEVMASQAKKDMDAFQYVIAGVDAHTNNYLVKVDPQTKKWQLMPIDMDASLPPSAQRYTHGYPGNLGAWQAPLPKTMSAQFRTQLENLAKNKESLRQTLATYLAPAEIDGVMKRLEDLLKDSDPAMKNPNINLVP